MTDQPAPEQPAQAPRPRHLGPESALTPSQLTRLRLRGKERRKVTPERILARVKGVLEAHRQHDHYALVGSLEDLASACMAWASALRHDRGWPPIEAAPAAPAQKPTPVDQGW